MSVFQKAVDFVKYKDKIYITLPTGVLPSITVVN